MSDDGNDEENDDVSNFVKNIDETSEAQEEETSDDVPNADNSVDKPSSSKDKTFKLSIDMSSIPCIPQNEQEDELQGLGVVAYEQRSYEQGVLKQVDEALKGQTEAKSKEATLKEKIRSVLAFQSTSEEPTNDSFLLKKSEISSDVRQKLQEIKDKIDSVKPLNYQDSENEECDDMSLKKPDSDDDYQPSSSELQEYDLHQTSVKRIRSPSGERSSSIEDDRKRSKPDSGRLKLKIKKCDDDGDERIYQKRISEAKRLKILQREGEVDQEEPPFDDLYEVDGGYKVPARIWNKLYNYQQVGVKWLWELHQLGVGGIMGDEMGLGKTIQLIAFLAGLRVSEVSTFRDDRKILGPVILVTPVTVMHQWVSEFHSWWPFFRVAILHSTGSYKGHKDKLIRVINRCCGILITSYCSITSYQDILYEYDWHYVVLDEGHKIRNPDAQTTLACKRFRTPHRIILSGSPIQNNLKELWSLFDFIYPGKLGTLPVFMEKFAVPITQGGYANATKVQLEIAYRCTTVLQDAIKPYLLRRAKDEVQQTLNLPSKNEQVLFCTLTDEQRQVYRSYLDTCGKFIQTHNKKDIFVSLINLRKICNHPDLFTGGPTEESLNSDCFGYYKRSGKMKVVDVLLRLWHEQNHKVLLFTQGKQMLNILEKFIKHREYTYLIMDGSTSVGIRHKIVKEFNENKNIFIFLLTTRVGGIGLNLVGANRVLIYDPDWNPTTDTQARERAWRIGQGKQVTIYRLLTTGTVEEKIYHRQVFKQYLTNRVLKDAKQQRFFKTNDLYELFKLGSDSGSTESSAIFTGTGSNVKVNKKAKKPKNNLVHKDDSEISLPPEKIEKLRLEAKRLSQMIGEKFATKSLPPTAPTSTSQSNQSNVNSHPQLHQETLKKQETTKKVKKKRKGAIFEGTRIKYLAKTDIYQPGTSDGTDSTTSKQQDDYVLKKLFKKSKVHSALQHDVIEGAKRTDYEFVESEAEKVANEAIQALKRSREMCFSASSGIPTWTGSSNTLPKAKAFGVKSNTFGAKSMSSSELMKSMKQRKKFEQDEPVEADKMSIADGLLTDLRNYIAFQASKDGEASTKEILDKFKTKIAPEQTPLFKSLLWKICDFNKNSDGTGTWHLKSEFR